MNRGAETEAFLRRALCLLFWVLKSHNSGEKAIKQLDRSAQLGLWLESHFPSGSFTMSPASADASFRRYFRLSFADARPACSAYCVARWRPRRCLTRPLILPSRTRKLGNGLIHRTGLWRTAPGLRCRPRLAARTRSGQAADCNKIFPTIRVRLARGFAPIGVAAGVKICGGACDLLANKLARKASTSLRLRRRA